MDVGITAVHNWRSMNAFHAENLRVRMISALPRGYFTPPHELWRMLDPV